MESHVRDEDVTISVAVDHLELGRKPSQSDEHPSGCPALPPIPSEDQYLNEPGYFQVRNAKDFEDMNLSHAAAGFVSYRPLSMLMRRWPFRAFIAVIGVYMTLYTITYALKYRSTDLDEPFDLSMLAAAVYGVPAVMMWLGIGLSLQACGQARSGVVSVGLGIAFHGVATSALWLPFAFPQGLYELATYTLLLSIIEGMMAVCFLFAEHLWWHMGLICSNLGVLVSATLVVLFGYYSALLALVPAVLWLVMTAFFLVWRHRTLRRAQLATLPDKKRYDAVWEPVKREKAEALRSLSDVVNSREHIRVLQPFVSLEVIFQRGYSLNKWYQTVVADWAAAVGGRACPAPVKSLQRTLEKVHRSYKGHVPPVIDIIRSTMIVDEIETLETALTFVCDRCCVHQIKNRFDLDYDGELTAGYRDLNIHLSFWELESTKFRGFVFELQIHYGPILSLKNDAGHARYITLRNLRGD